MIIRIMYILLGCLFIYSCEYPKTKQYDLLINSHTAEELYLTEVPDESFVFCLDSIKTIDEFGQLYDKYCKNEKHLDSFIYLSSYKVYLPVFLNDYCDDLDVIACGVRRNHLNFIANESLQWLVEGELVNEMNQHKLDSIVSNYYLALKRDKMNKYSLISYELSSVKNNNERDSLYVSLVTGYYHFIKSEKKERSETIENLTKEFPFRLYVGSSLFLMPPLINVENVN